MSTNVTQSAVIQAPIEKVWELLRPLDFKFLPTVEKVEPEGKGFPATVGTVFSIRYKDSTVQKIKLMGLSDISHTLTYDVIESQPAVKYSSALHTIQLKRVSMGNNTFMTWTTDFSKDAGQDVLQDSKYKKLEAFKSLHAFVMGSKSIAFYRQLSEPTRFPSNTSSNSDGKKDMLKGDSPDSRVSLD
mmetsp:Transcript_4017/g.9462  ORF Transcript_4017/g.9462 Transcript_4017/m.9462 type:complete len:187 (+) Transcript_4017:41-601(+)